MSINSEFNEALSGLLEMLEYPHKNNALLDLCCFNKFLEVILKYDKTVYSISSQAF